MGAGASSTKLSSQIGPGQPPTNRDSLDKLAFKSKTYAAAVSRIQDLEALVLELREQISKDASRIQSLEAQNHEHKSPEVSQKRPDVWYGLVLELREQISKDAARIQSLEAQNHELKSSEVSQKRPDVWYPLVSELREQISKDAARIQSLEAQNHELKSSEVSQKRPDIAHSSQASSPTKHNAMSNSSSSPQKHNAMSNSSSNLASVSECVECIKTAQRRRDDTEKEEFGGRTFLRKIFDEHAKDCQTLSSQMLINALIAADSPIIPQLGPELDKFIKQFDSNNNSSLDFHEFEQAVNAPDDLQEWCGDLGIVFAADALRLLVERSHERNQKVALETTGKKQDVGRAYCNDQLKLLSELSAADIGVAAEALSSVIGGVLLDAHYTLREAFAVSDHHDTCGGRPSKFNEALPQMACGDVSAFHKGLTKRVGHPNLEFFDTMIQEHCERDGCDQEFTTTNYGITTTPKKEWQYVVNKLPCPENQMHEGRKIVAIEELEKLPLAEAAKLETFEIIAVVLYTGPMFQIYNSILRQFPPSTYDMFKNKNLFSTTIFVLVSAIQKLCQKTRIPDGTRLYRGVGGLNMPDSFYEIDKQGCTGYTEWGFGSTTSNLHTALGYSGVHQKRAKAMVMVIETSSIDRGADISQFSQYSNEQEFLYLPCSFIQKRRGSGRVKVINGGLVTFVPIKVNLNIKMQTVTQLKKQKKELHLVSARAMMDGVKFQVAKWVKEKQEKDELKLFLKIFPDDVHLSQMQKFADDILDKCSKVVQKHKGKQVKDYANDQTFQELISEVLCIKSDATEAVKWQENRMRLTNGDTALQIQSKYKRLKMGAVAFGHQNFVYSVAFHPTLPIFATGSKDRTVKVWRFKSDNSPATCVKTLDSKDFKSDNSAAADAAGPHVTCVAFHPNPNLPFFATCCQNEDVNRSAILWQINPYEFHLKPVLFATLQGHNDSVECAAFHRVAPVLATGSWDRTIMLWRFNPKIPCNPKEPLLPLATLLGHGEGVLCLAFHPNYSQFLASCSKDRTAKLWRLEANNSSASCVATCDEDGISESECVDVSDGQGEYEGFDDQHEDEDYDEGSGEERDGDDDSFDRGGNYLSVDERENDDDDDDERDDSEEEEEETIECDEYDEDDENEEEEEEEEGEEDEGGIQCLAFHPKLPILATTHGKTARLWFLGKFLQSDSSLPTCATPHTIACEQKDEEEDNAACVSLAFHPTLSILATGSYDGAARLWHLEFDGATSVKSEKCINQLDGHSDSVQCIAFHPSAPVLVTGSWDNTAKVWCLDQK